MPKEIIISWCNENREIGPVFIARCINIFETIDKIKKPTNLLIALLENFGNDDKVGRNLSANIISRGWSGSLVTYLESDKIALEPLLLDYQVFDIAKY